MKIVTLSGFILPLLIAMLNVCIRGASCFIAPAVLTSRSGAARLFRGGRLGAKQRLDKILSNRGHGSRKQVTKIILSDRVKLLDGQVLKSGKEKFDLSTEFEVDGEPSNPLPHLLVFSKPSKVLTDVSSKDGLNRASLAQYMPPITASCRTYGVDTFHPVGRLDFETTGLLLFSSSGPLTHFILSPASKVPKVYVATVKGLVKEDGLRERLKSGVETADGIFCADLKGVAKAKATSAFPERSAGDQEVAADEAASAATDENGGDEAAELRRDAKETLTDLTLAVTEGKHRMVRRMLFNAGHEVVELKRIRVGQIEIGDMEEGTWRELTEIEKDWTDGLVSDTNRRSQPKKREKKDKKKVDR